MDVLTLGVHTMTVLSSCAGLASLSPRRGTLLIVSFLASVQDSRRQPTPWGIVLGLIIHRSLSLAISRLLCGDRLVHCSAIFRATPAEETMSLRVLSARTLTPMTEKLTSR